MSVSAPAAIVPRESLLRFTTADLGYGAVTVLRQVDLTVNPGEFWAVVGRNGTGKSTLLKNVVGELTPLTGTLDRHDDLTVGHRLAWVPQRVEITAVLPTTVREFAGLGMTGLGLDRDQRGERLRQALIEVALDGLAGADLARLSGGQRQRCLLARALVRQPRLLVLDEPTAGLDADTEAAFLATLFQMHRHLDLAVILVTHDAEVARDLATHVALCSGGVVRCGPAAAMLTGSRSLATAASGSQP